MQELYLSNSGIEYNTTHLFCLEVKGNFMICSYAAYKLRKEKQNNVKAGACIVHSNNFSFFHMGYDNNIT